MVRATRAIPGFPGARPDRLGFGVGGKPRDERVFARAAAENENSHRLNELGRVTALHGEAARAGLFR